MVVGSILCYESPLGQRTVFNHRVVVGLANALALPSQLHHRWRPALRSGVVRAVDVAAVPLGLRLGRPVLARRPPRQGVLHGREGPDAERDADPGHVRGGPHHGKQIPLLGQGGPNGHLDHHHLSQRHDLSDGPHQRAGHPEGRHVRLILGEFDVVERELDDVEREPWRPRDPGAAPQRRCSRRSPGALQDAEREREQLLGPVLGNRCGLAPDRAAAARQAKNFQWGASGSGKMQPAHCGAAVLPAQGRRVY
mmetsp:Transcript_161241/g.517649  ORF Transcript_161241/g.517649 Transcript_161241/m.517649 type:complete len:252 (-) Transcript_161241:443-1198(-)